MISSEQKNIPTEVEHVIEQFLVDQKVHFATITKSNAQYKATIEKRTGQKVLSNINYLIGVALRQGTNILTITQNGYECMLETFLQRSLIEAYTGTILFLVPDTTTCKALQETFQEHLSTDHMVPITALETLPEKHILLADVVVSSGPVIQSCLMSPEKASTLASWLATVKLVVIPNMQYLSLAKRTLTLSLLQLLRPQQVFLTTSHEHAIQDLEQFMTKLTCKKTQILRFQKDQADKHYFLITKDFTFAKRTALLKQLLNQPQLNFIFTQTKAASQKVYYELKKNIV